jgi:hypothetical protein
MYLTCTVLRKRTDGLRARKLRLSNSRLVFGTDTRLLLLAPAPAVLPLPLGATSPDMPHASAGARSHLHMYNRLTLLFVAWLLHTGICS